MPTISLQTRFSDRPTDINALFDDYISSKYDPSCKGNDKYNQRSIFRYVQTSDETVSAQELNRRQQSLKKRPPDVAGRDRTKFFDVRHGTAAITGAELAVAINPPSRWRCGALIAAQQPSAELQQPVAMVTRSTQTMYRDSECQTEPYSPPFSLSHGAWTEVLSLSGLTWGHGLPGQQTQVAMVRRMRRQRAMLNSDPATSPASSSSAAARLRWRVHMVNSIEREEWAVREHQMAEIQVLRIELMRRLQYEQEEQRQQRVNERLQCFWKQSCQIRDEKIAKIQTKLARDCRRLRRICDSRQMVYPNLRHVMCQQLARVQLQRDAEKTFISGGVDNVCTLVAKCRTVESHVTTRDNNRPGNDSQQQRYLHTRSGIAQLERYCSDLLPPVRVERPLKPASYLLKTHFYRKHRVLNTLNRLYDHIKEEKTRSPPTPCDARLLEKIPKRPEAPSPPAPILAPPSSASDVRQLAGIRHLQQVIRGRAVQRRIERGISRRRHLIDELRSTHALTAAENLDKLLQRRSVAASQRLSLIASLQDGVIDEALSRIESATLSRLLISLSNELIRLQEEKRVHAFCMLAERERQMREAAEAGLRQKELRRRREIDEIFKQEMKVRQDTVEQYLEETLLHSVDTVSVEQARCQLQLLISQLSSIDERLQDSEDTEHQVAALVHGFIVPHVHSEHTRSHVMPGHSWRHLAAARDTINSLLAAASNKKMDNDVTSPEFGHNNDSENDRNGAIEDKVAH